MRIGLLALVLAAALMSTAASAEIRVASWNLNNLHHQLDEPLRPGAPARTEADIEILRKYRDRADADIFALQEVNGPKAAQLVFPTEQWDLFFSGRYADDLITGRESDRIYTGFAVRRGVFDAVSKRDVPEISVRHTDGRPTRWGTEILVEKEGDLLRLMSVHLKSGCHGGSLEPATTPDCVTLAAQRAPLESWIDAAASSLGAIRDRGGLEPPDERSRSERSHLGRDRRRRPARPGSVATAVSTATAAATAGFTKPIDFIVLRLSRLGAGRARHRLRRSSTTRATGMRIGDTPSDHCPIVVALDWPAAD